MRYLNYKVILYTVHMWNYLIFLRNLDVEEKREEGKRVGEKEKKGRRKRKRKREKHLFFFSFFLDSWEGKRFNFSIFEHSK